jgi:glycerol-1-phosphatase
MSHTSAAGTPCPGETACAREQSWPEAGAIRTLLIDLDGVVWVGGNVVPGAMVAIRLLRENGIDLSFVTNDPRSARDYYSTRLTRLGAPARPDEVVTSGQALARLVNDRHSRTEPVLVIGTSNLRREFERLGSRLVDEKSSPSVVAVGGHDDFDYGELRRAVQAVSNGALLYTAGRDPTFPMPDGPWPGTGSIVAAIEYATSAHAICAGKPSRHIFEAALAGRDPAEAAIVGDTLASDIEGGRAIGMRTFLVMTGSTTAAHLASASVLPDRVFGDLQEVAMHLLADHRTDAHREG